jgi:predicted P-loop ATPase
VTEFSSDWDDEKWKRYDEFMEAQRDKGKVVVQLKPREVVVLPEQKPKTDVVVKQAKPEPEPKITNLDDILDFHPTDALTTIPTATEFSLIDRIHLRGLPLFDKTIAAMRTLGVTFSYDLFRDRYHVDGHALQQRFGESIENAILVLRTTVMQRFGFDPRAAAKDAVYRLCIENSFNPVLDYLDSLKWDSKPRLDTWLTTYLGAEDNPLNRAMGRKVLIAAVRRVRVPGTKFDQIMVLEGPQDSGKSTTVKILAGEFFSDAEIIGKYEREVQELCGGVWLYEISELAGLRKSDVDRVKAFASRDLDKARPAYGYAPVERKRTCIFIGTCNRDDYLIDETGNRRFWPVVTGKKIDLVNLQRDRDQLWAEASVAEATGEPLTIDPELCGEAALRADERLTTDPWEDILSTVEAMPPAPGSIAREHGEIRVASDFLLSGVLGINRGNMQQHQAKRLATVMKRLGWTGPRPMKMGVKAVRAYSKALAYSKGLSE